MVTRTAVDPSRSESGAVALFDKCIANTVAAQPMTLSHISVDEPEVLRPPPGPPLDPRPRKFSMMSQHMYMHIEGEAQAPSMDDDDEEVGPLRVREYPRGSRHRRSKRRVSIVDASQSARETQHTAMKACGIR